jgi:N-methylhydantoinase A/oxoprolinase/acetone carboxylase beta subunit
MVRKHDVKAFAVSGFAGVVNPEHELLVKQILKRETGLSVSCGHELSDLLDFRTRAYTAIMNGRIIPLLSKLLSDMEAVLRGLKIRAPIAVVRGDGSLMRKEAALERPVETILSGPAASVAGALHLTGRQDAIVVDMGGTTTDVAMLQNGRVETDESGSHVGGHKTHVRALRIRTLGLGGDSFITWSGDKFEIGPQRVASMAWAGAHAAGVDRAVDYIFDHLNYYWNDTKRLQILALQGRHDGLRLASQEEDILGLLKERVYGIQELAERIGMTYWNPGIIARLEENCFIQRCGFTPTDMLNCRGELALWDARASIRMCEVLSKVLGRNSAEIINELMREVTRRFALVVLKRQLDEEVNPEGLDDCEVCGAVIRTMMGDGGRGYDIRLKLHNPVIGIGTPVHHFLPAAAAMLGAEHILSDHADVANAVGAITSQVLVRRRVEIRACRGGGFRIEGLPGLRHFRDFSKALDCAEAELTQIVLGIAQSSGTAETEVKIHEEDHIYTTHNGRQIMMGCALLAELKGDLLF